MNTPCGLLGSSNFALDVLQKPAPSESTEPAQHLAKNKTPALDQYTINLTQKAQSGLIDPVIGREFEIRLMLDILMRRRQNNPILTGEPGVGKTAVVEGLTLKIVNNQVPDALKNVQLHTLDMGLLQAGASVKGEFENRLKQVIQEVQSATHPIILFIDEAHTLIGAGGQAGQNDAANLLKPALARGELRTIAATTWAEYKQYFEKDAALSRRFQVVKVEEPTEDVAIDMLRAMLPVMANHFNLNIDDEALLRQKNHLLKQVESYTDDTNSSQILEQFEQSLFNTSKSFQYQNYQHFSAILAEWSILKSVLDTLMGLDAPSFAAIDTQLEDIHTSLKKLYKTDVFTQPVMATQTSESSAAATITTQALSFTQHKEQEIDMNTVHPSKGFQVQPQNHLANREQAMRVLQEISDYFQANEPHSPVSYIFVFQ
jgi:hypothetical protein